ATPGGAHTPPPPPQPLSSSDRSHYYDPDWTNLGPRLAATWSPPGEEGFLGSLFKRDKTVLRGGYSLVFDRTNSVRHILSLGMGYGENLSVLGPRCNANGAGGQGCDPTAITSAPSSSYRIGVDGPAPIPSPQAVTSPIVPNNV